MNWTASIKTLWPIFLVATGATIMFSKKKRLTSGIWILTFILFIGFGVYKRNENTRILNFEENLQIELGPLADMHKMPTEKTIPLEQGTQEGRLILQIGSVKMDLAEGDNDLLVRLDSNIPKLEQRLSQGEQAILEYSHAQNNRRVIPHFNLKMNPVLIWEIDANLGVVDGILNFEQIPVKKADFRMGAGDLKVIIGDQQTETNINLWTGVTDLDIYIPKEAGLQVKAGNFMSDLDFHNIKVNKQDEIFISENYETAEQKIYVNIISAMSAVKFSHNNPKTTIASINAALLRHLYGCLFFLCPFSMGSTVETCIQRLSHLFFL